MLASRPVSAPPIVADEKPENELLLACARVQLSERQRARLAELAALPLDWDEVRESAKRHGVRPLLYKHLNEICPDAPPAGVMSQLRADYADNVRRALVQTAELHKQLALYEREGIAALPFRGPTLAAAYYSNVSLRQCTDLDVLVRTRDVPRAVKLVQNQGYKAFWHVTPKQKRLILKTDCEYPVVRLEDAMVFEVHWRFVPTQWPFSLNYEALEPRLRDETVSGRRMKMLRPEDLLLVTCVHSAKHMWCRIKWLTDVAEIVRSGQLDWDDVFARARALGCVRMLRLGLFLSEQLVDAELPARARAYAHADPAVPALAERSQAILFRNFDPHAPAGHGWPGMYDRSSYYASLMERPIHKAHYWLRFLTTPIEEDFEIRPLPDRLFALYYVNRPLRIAGWFARWAWRRIWSR